MILSRARGDSWILVSQNLVGQCGIYCGACGILRAYEDGGVYRQRLAENFTRARTRNQEFAPRCGYCSR